MLLVPQSTLMDLNNVMKLEDDHEIITKAMWIFFYYQRQIWTSQQGDPMCLLLIGTVDDNLKKVTTENLEKHMRLKNRVNLIRLGQNS